MTPATHANTLAGTGLQPERSSAPTLSVVIPVYEEQDRIGATLADVLATLEAWGVDAQVVLVDDGCTDNTPQVLKPWLGRSGRVVVECLRHERNMGKGAAVRTGFLASHGVWVLMMDADNSTRLSELVRLTSAMKSEPVHLTIGSRVARGAVVQSGWKRRLSGRAFHACLRLLGLALARDTQCGFKFYRGDAARYLAERARENGFAFDVEHLLLAKRAGMRVVEVGVKWEHAPGGSIRVVRDGLRMLLAAVRIRRRIAREGHEPYVESVPQSLPASIVELKPTIAEARATIS